MAELPKILLFRNGPSDWEGVAESLGSVGDLTIAGSLDEGLEAARQSPPDLICLNVADQCPVELMLETGGLLGQIPAGLLVLDSVGNVIWHNVEAARLIQLWSGEPNGDPGLDQIQFSDVLESGFELMGPDFSPLNTALGSGEQTRSVLRRGEKQYLEASFTPIREPNSDFPSHVLVLLRDKTQETLQQEKLGAIIQAGIDLGDLEPEDVVDLTVEDRIELLKSKLLHYTQGLLEFETVEIRVVEHGTGRLVPLLSFGMQETAEARELFARADSNGVTGFVAATGRSYLCENTNRDPLYLPGAEGAKSSLTVPLVLNEQVLGTFNVESPRTGAFTDTDLQYLELFCREVAMALNTLDLLAAEKATTLVQSTKQVLCDVADPVDEILNNAAWILEKHAGDQEVQGKLQQILGKTRQIRQRIMRASESLPTGAGRGAVQVPQTCLRSKRILVADGDREIRRSAHELLGRLGCIVETAHDGEEALRMSRTFHYDVVLADIRLPDLSGSQIFRSLKEIRADMPVILTTVFGYDGDHAIVKARQAGMKRALFKPFRTDKLVTAIEEVVNPDG